MDGVPTTIIYISNTKFHQWESKMNPDQIL